MMSRPNFPDLLTWVDKWFLQSSKQIRSPACAFTIDFNVKAFIFKQEALEGSHAFLSSYNRNLCSKHKLAAKQLHEIGP